MRCEECGRAIDNAEMWQLGGDRNAPASWSMRVMCWDCRARQSTPHRENHAAVVLSPTVIADINEAAGNLERYAV